MGEGGETVASQLASNASLNAVNIADFKRLAPEITDSGRINRAIQSIERVDGKIGGVLKFTPGLYTLSDPIVITNRTSLLLDKQTVIKATSPMTVMIDFDGIMNEPLAEYWDYGCFVKGGVIDGNDLASCLSLKNALTFKLRDTWYKNFKEYGVRFGDATTIGGYELIASNLVFRNTTEASLNNIAIDMQNAGDSHFSDIICVNCTTGVNISALSTANRFNRVHVWNTQASRINNTTGFVIRGMSTFSDCYCDTTKIGFDIWTDSEFYSCHGANNAQFGLTGCTYFNKRDYTAKIKIIGGHFSGIASENSYFGKNLFGDSTVIRDVAVNGLLNAPFPNKDIYNTTNYYYSDTKIMSFKLPVAGIPTRLQMFIDVETTGVSGTVKISLADQLYVSVNNDKIKNILAFKLTSTDATYKYYDVYYLRNDYPLTYAFVKFLGRYNQECMIDTFKTFLIDTTEVVMQTVGGVGLPGTDVTVLNSNVYNFELDAYTVPANSVIYIDTGITIDTLHSTGWAVNLYPIRSVFASINYYADGGPTSQNIYITIFNPNASPIPLTGVKAKLFKAVQIQESYM